MSAPASSTPRDAAPPDGPDACLPERASHVPDAASPEVIRWMLPRDIQLANEYTYSRKHVDRYLRAEVRGEPETRRRVAHGVELLGAWLSLEHRQATYASKRVRLEQLVHTDLEELVVGVFAGVAYAQAPETLVSVASRLACHLGMACQVEAVTTMAEILAILCETDAYDIVRETRGEPYRILARIPLSSRVRDYIGRTAFLPPMVCEPEPVTQNAESAYLTHNDSLILRYNLHTDPIALDVINLQNRIPLRLSERFLARVEQEPTYALDTLEKTREWETYQRQCHAFYLLLVNQTRASGGRIYLTYRYDKRGRMYASGYHISTQGVPFTKAIVELADAEHASGMPEEYQLS